MKILQIRFARKEFDRIPEAERTLLVMLGHVANDLNVLVRLFHWSALALDATPIEARANNVIVLTVVRLFTAKLYEAWKLLSRPVAGGALKKWCESELGQEEQAALDRLKTYFGRNNLIKEVRHRHSFHYSHEDVTAAYASIPENEEFEMYLGDSDLNNLYYFADVITGRALLHSIDPEDHEGAMERFRNRNNASPCRYSCGRDQHARRRGTKAPREDA